MKCPVRSHRHDTITTTWKNAWNFDKVTEKEYFSYFKDKERSMHKSCNIVAVTMILGSLIIFNT